jgi:hypothetical protein
VVPGTIGEPMSSRQLNWVIVDAAGQRGSLSAAGFGIRQETVTTGCGVRLSCVRLCTFSAGRCTTYQNKLAEQRGAEVTGERERRRFR